MSTDAMGDSDQYREWSTQDLVKAITLDGEDYERWVLSAIREELQRRQISPDERAVLETEALKQVERDRATSLLQHRVNALLFRGGVFSVVWLAGLGSIFAVFCAVKAKKIIEQSRGELSGMGRVWFCLIVGGLGILIWGPIIVINVFNRFARG